MGTNMGIEMELWGQQLDPILDLLHTFEIRGLMETQK